MSEPLTAAEQVRLYLSPERKPEQFSRAFVEKLLAGHDALAVRAEAAEAAIRSWQKAREAMEPANAAVKALRAESDRQDDAFRNALIVENCDLRTEVEQLRERVQTAEAELAGYRDTAAGIVARITGGGDVPDAADARLAGLAQNPAGFGTSLRDARRTAGLSLRALAKITGVPFNTLARTERGAEPSLANFRRITAWLGESRGRADVPGADGAARALSATQTDAQHSEGARVELEFGRRPGAPTGPKLCAQCGQPFGDRACGPTHAIEASGEGRA